jgi:hypothetical protein
MLTGSQVYHHPGSFSRSISADGSTAKAGADWQGVFLQRCKWPLSLFAGTAAAQFVMGNVALLMVIL